MRVATFADREGAGEAFARRAWQLAFGDGHDITKVDDRVIAAAGECGLDPDEARAAVDAPQIKQALRDANDSAVARGVIGVPTVAVGAELFWGDDRLDEAAAALAAHAR
jgi:2-hydroxychromene-2-carboxylate isomerase